MHKLKILIFIILLSFIGMSMSSCAIRVTETHRDNGRHVGWFKHRTTPHVHQTYVIRKSSYKPEKATRTVQVEVKNKKKNRWDAKK